MKSRPQKKTNMQLKIVRQKNGMITGVLIGVFGTLIATGVIYIVSEIKERNEEKANYINLTNSINIGMGRRIIENTLGDPLFMNSQKDSTILECLYKGYGSLVRVFYDADRTVAFFITLTEYNYVGKYLNEIINRLTDYKTVGKFTYDEILNDQDLVTLPENYGVFINGTGYVWYYEKYYLGSLGHYHDLYLAIVPYGIFILNKKINFIDEITARHFSPNHLGYFGNSFPNTFGIVSREYKDTIPVISSHDDYDLMSINIYFEQSLKYRKKFERIGPHLFFTRIKNQERLYLFHELQINDEHTNILIDEYVNRYHIEKWR